MDFLKKYKFVVILIVVIIIGALGAWYFVLPKSTQAPQEQAAENIKSIKPEDIGLSLEFSSDMKNVLMKVSKLAGINSLEYDMSWDALEKSDEGEGIVSKGSATTDPVNVKGKSEYKQEIRLGTCSASKCRDDNVKSDIKLNLKVNYANGEVGEVEMTLPYPNK